MGPSLLRPGAVDVGRTASYAGAWAFGRSPSGGGLRRSAWIRLASNLGKTHDAMLDRRAASGPATMPRTEREKECVLDMRLELVPLPSTDVDRSKAFYVDQVGFNIDHDVEPGNGMRVVQLTPPGSACSIVIGVGISDPKAAPVLNLHLVVDDLDVARRTLIGNGIDVSDVNDLGGGIRYAYFSHPDGNSWALQQISG